MYSSLHFFLSLILSSPRRFSILPNNTLLIKLSFPPPLFPFPLLLA